MVNLNFEIYNFKYPLFHFIDQFSDFGDKICDILIFITMFLNFLYQTLFYFIYAL